MPLVKKIVEDKKEGADMDLPKVVLGVLFLLLVVLIIMFIKEY